MEYECPYCGSRNVTRLEDDDGFIGKYSCNDCAAYMSEDEIMEIEPQEGNHARE